MHRRALLNLLAAHQPFDDAEAAALREITAFVQAHPDCFERSLDIGHVTGSAWLIDESGQRALLTHHRKLDKWLQLGGHADGNPDVLAVAIREAEEESGLQDIVPVSTAIFDVDVHPIPAHGGVPPHVHYDVRFLLRARGPTDFVVSDESHDLAWVRANEIPTLNTDDSVLRMGKKWQQCTGRSL